MENSQFNKIVDIRQSPGWAIFLESLGWKVLKTSSGINIAVMKSLLGTVAKVQRPNVLAEKDLAEIDEICQRECCMFVKIEPVPNQDLKILEKAGFTKSFFPLLPPSTVLIDLTANEDTLWFGLSKTARNLTRRMQKTGTKVEIHQNPSDEILKKLYDVCHETAQEKKFIDTSFAEFKKKTEIFGDNAFVILVKNEGGQIVGASFCVGFEGCVWGLNTGITAKGRKGNESYLQLWETFLYFKNLGYKWMDLEGRDDPRFPNFTKSWGGFSHFKEKFGGTSVQFPYPQLKLYSPVLKFLKRLFGKIPL